MYKPLEGEYVKEDAPIAEAIDQLVKGVYNSLLVKSESEIV